MWATLNNYIGHLKSIVALLEQKVGHIPWFCLLGLAHMVTSTKLLKRVWQDKVRRQKARSARAELHYCIPGLAPCIHAIGQLAFACGKNVV